MMIELHYLQNFVPSNLNRDDTGAPKDCEFGGHRRARISSQCLKRAIRQAFKVHELFGRGTSEQLAERTKRIVEEATALLREKGKPEDEARRLLKFALESAKLTVDDTYETQYLLFVPRRLIKGLAGVVLEHWDTLKTAAPVDAPRDPGLGDGAKKKSKKAEKTAAKEAVPKEVASAVAELFADASKTPDLALFGRMIADSPDWNVDAACQVAHAISTNRVSMEFDFYTAVDDLKPRADSGAGMMGTVAFNSACFYRYACVDVGALRQNLGDREGDLTKKTIEAFLRASALAIPSGKQNSMAAQNRPSYLLAVVRETGAPQSLANAFVAPVRPDGEGLIAASVRSLESYLDATLDLWGDQGLSLLSCGDVPTQASKRPTRAASFDAWVSSVVSAAGKA
jgi:CRISPR system Cascade subunit CasC